MPWYGRTKLVFDSLRRNINPKIIPRSHLPSRTNPAKFYGFSSIASRELGLGLGSLGKTNNPFLSQAKRNYCSNRHFKPRRWTQNPTKVVLVATAAMIVSPALIILYLGNFETVPYTKRTHFLLVTKSAENQIGETQFEQIKETYKGKILPANHPESIRVRLIAKEVIHALQRGLSHERAWSELGYASVDSDKGVKEMEMAVSGDGGDGETMSGTKWSKDDEIQQSRKKDTQAASSHLQGINWEVLVVDDPMVNAFSFPAGKIVVLTGLLNHCKSDAEVATVIGHEVGHVVARHAAERITKILCRCVLKLMLFQNPMPDLENTSGPHFLNLPLSRKMEIEADYIGLLLLASAGYDPRIAPNVYEELGKLGGDGVPTHPSGEKRSQLLAQANVMEEALTIYRQVQSGRRVHGFVECFVLPK